MWRLLAWAALPMAPLTWGLLLSEPQGVQPGDFVDWMTKVARVDRWPNAISLKLASKPTVTKENIIEALWDGQDFREGSFPFEKLGRRTIGERSVERNVQVMGLQHSGIDLLNAVLYTNFGDRLNYHSLPSNSSNHAPGMWKHTNMRAKFSTEPEKLQTILTPSDLHLITMVRSPLSWLRAMKENPPPEMEACFLGEDWISRPCTHQCPGGKSPEASGPMEFKNLEKIWNHWTEGYVNADHYGVTNHLTVSYEELVQEPKAVVARIASFLKVTPPAGIVVPDTSDTHGEAFALDRIRSRSHMKTFSQTQFYQACEMLDVELMELFDYTECEPVAKR